jgi:N-acetylglucosaminyldiphosphoundecaprenol N-acetyl-beta-D-mannosaminyltransferase
VTDRGAAILGAQFPGLEIESEHGYFDSGPPSETGEAVLGRVRAFRPHILCLAMGIPRQEHWIEDHLDRSEARVVLNLGGFMDLLTGELPMPPRWALRVRLERLVRLVSRPRRIWLRYLCEPWFLLPLLARDVRSRFTR